MCGEAFSRSYSASDRAAFAAKPTTEHDARLVEYALVMDFVTAYLNNNTDEVERLRRRIAPMSLPKPRRAKADVAADLAALVSRQEGFIRVFTSTDFEYNDEIDTDRQDELDALIHEYDAAL